MRKGKFKDPINTSIFPWKLPKYSAGLVDPSFSFVITEKHGRGCAALSYLNGELLEVGAVVSVYERLYPKPSRELVFSHTIFSFPRMNENPNFLRLSQYIFIFHSQNSHKRMLCDLQSVQIRFHLLSTVIMPCVTLRRGYFLKNASLGDFVVVRTS
jgi:hypothetical protein